MTQSDTMTQNTGSTFNEKRVLITGGTQGLGKALTLQLVKLGAKVTVVARTETDLVTLSDQSNQIFTIRGDIGNKEDIHRISGQAVGFMEGIDILINNASYLGSTPLRSLNDTECENFEEVLQTNLLGPFRLIKAVIAAMKFMKSGIIVNISSDAARNAYPTWGSYSVSKAGLDHLTAIWNEELADDPIKFVSLDPGDMRTRMHFDAIPEADPNSLYDPEEVARDLLQFLGRDSFDHVRYDAQTWRECLD